MDYVNIKHKRILVTGGNGYLGRNLLKRLVSLRAKVFCIDFQQSCIIENVECFIVDLRDKDEVKRVITIIQPEIIYHLAASIDRTRDFESTADIFKVNVNGTINLLNALNNIKYENLIFTSTSEVYGGNSIVSPFNEECDFVPASPYSLSKFSAEMSIRTFSELRNRNYTILRLFNFYGEDMPNNFFISQLIEKLKNNEDFDMTYGEQKRDFHHINDTLDSLIIATEKKAYNQVFNVCSGKAKTIKEIALEIKEELKSKSKINFGALPYRDNEIMEMVGDNLKIRSVLGFVTKHDLRSLLIN